MSRADEIVRQTIENAYSTAVSILKENKTELDRAATYLLERETITGKEFMDILETCQREKLALQSSEDVSAN